MPSGIETPTTLAGPVELRSVGVRYAPEESTCDTCGTDLAGRDASLAGTVRHQVFGRPEYSTHPFCGERCLYEWVEHVREAGGDVRAPRGE